MKPLGAETTSLHRDAHVRLEPPSAVATTESMPCRGIEIIVPCFRNEELIAPLFDSILACADELRGMDATIVVINDSPNHEPLKMALVAAVKQSAGHVPVTIIDNPRNLGFIRSCNLGLARAVAAEKDALLLNSDTVLYPGSVTEMVRITKLDPMIGFVSPRSNNATIASLPLQERYRHQAPECSFHAFRQLSAQLPDFHYTPTAVGFCLLIKNAVLREFGFLDQTYGAGYNEENDLIMRANRCGYRAALANKAFVYHRGEASFGAAERSPLELENSRLLAERYPEYPYAVQAYESGPIHQAEQLLAGLLPDADGRHDLLLDFSDLGSYHNGTIEAAKTLLREFVARHTDRFNIFVIMHAEHARFHGIDRIAAVQVLPVDTDRQFAVGLRVGQPFSRESLLRMNRLAVRTAWFMLDTITWDCLYLRTPDLDSLWQHVFEHGDAIIYNSDFTRRQFATRFRSSENQRHLVSPHSLDPTEYLPTGRKAGLQGDHILVVGNKFAHKYVEPTVDALVAAVPKQSIVCLGLKHHPHHAVTCHESGHLSTDEIESLYERASVVVFPSHYEGFGFPLIKGLAYEKPVIMRDGEMARQMAGLLGGSRNIVLYRDTASMAAMVAENPPRWQTEPRTHGARRWADSAAEIAACLTEIISLPNACVAVARRLNAFSPNHGRTSENGGDASNSERHIPRFPPQLHRLAAFFEQRPAIKAVLRPLWRLIWR